MSKSCETFSGVSLQHDYQLFCEAFVFISNVVNAASLMITEPVSVQRCCPGREDLRHRRHSQQRGSSPGQHGDLWAQHQHLDSAAVPPLSALQTRLRRHQKVHSERLMTPRWQQTPAELRDWGVGGAMGDSSVKPDQSADHLWIWCQQPSTSSTRPIRANRPEPFCSPVQNVLMSSDSSTSPDDAWPPVLYALSFSQHVQEPS